MSDAPALDDISVAGRDVAAPDEDVHLHGPPGTGKTTQAARRVAELIENHGHDPGDVSWITYRRDLVEDTFQRLSNWGVLLEEEWRHQPSQGATRYYSTMNAVGRRLMTNMDPEVLHEILGVGPRENLGTAADQSRIEFCSKAGIRMYGTGHRKGTGELLFETWRWARHNLRDPREEDGLQAAPTYEELTGRLSGNASRFYKEWCDWKVQRGEVDYVDMLEEPLKRDLSPGRDILVLDELHDFTPLMAAVAIEWARDANVIIAAGDPHQVVNGYEGPTPELYRYIVNELDLPTVQLEQSYRVPANHYGAAFGLLQRAHEPPQVTPEPVGGFDVRDSPTFNHESGANPWVHGQVPGTGSPDSPVDLYDPTCDQMYLARTRLFARGVMRSFDEAGIPYCTQSTMTGWLSDDRLELHNLIQRVQDVEMSGDSQSRLTSGKSPSDVELQPEEARVLCRHVPVDVLEASREDMEQLQRAIERAPTNSSTYPLSNLHITDAFIDRFCRGALRAAKNLNRWYDSRRDREALENALRRYDRPIPRKIAENTVVQTIHASKGSQAEQVFLYDGVTRKIYDDLLEDDDAEANEWRTWYVGMTRAQESLVILQNAWTNAYSILPDDLHRYAQAVQHANQSSSTAD